MRDSKGSGFEELEYKLRIVDARDGEAVYVRRGLAECVYRVEEDLPLRRPLRWTVRARYRREGSLRVTPWTGPRGGDRDAETGPGRSLGVPLSVAGP